MYHSVASTHLPSSLTIHLVVPKAGLGRYGVDLDTLETHISTKPIRTFRAWMEDWEKQLLRKDDPLVHAKFKQKYGNLCWRDADHDDELVTADDTKVHFNNSSKRSEKGYQVIGLHPGYDPKNVLSEDYDNWVIDQPSALWFDLRVLQVQPRPFHSCCNPAPVFQLRRNLEL